MNQNKSYEFRIHSPAGVPSSNSTVVDSQQVKNTIEEAWKSAHSMSAVEGVITVTTATGHSFVYTPTHVYTPTQN